MKSILTITTACLLVASFTNSQASNQISPSFSWLDMPSLHIYVTVGAATLATISAFTLYKMRSMPKIHDVFIPKYARISALTTKDKDRYAELGLSVAEHDLTLHAMDSNNTIQNFPLDLIVKAVQANTVIKIPRKNFFSPEVHYPLKKLAIYNDGAHKVENQKSLHDILLHVIRENKKRPWNDANEKNILAECENTLAKLDNQS